MQSGLPLVVVNHITFHVPTQPLPNPFLLSLMAIAAVAPIAPLSAQWRERLHCDSLLRLYGCAVACAVCRAVARTHIPQRTCGRHCAATVGRSNRALATLGAVGTDPCLCAVQLLLRLADARESGHARLAGSRAYALLRLVSIICLSCAHPTAVACFALPSDRFAGSFVCAFLRALPLRAEAAACSGAAVASTCAVTSDFHMGRTCGCVGSFTHTVVRALLLLSPYAVTSPAL